MNSPNPMPEPVPSPIVPSGSTVGTFLGGSAAALLIYILGLFHVYLPAGAEAQIAVMIATFVGMFPKSGRAVIKSHAAVTLLIALMAFPFLTSCASLGLQSPQSLDDRVAYAYGVHTAVLKTAANDRQKNLITQETGTQVLNLADQALGLLDAAKTIEQSNGDLSTAEAKLNLATDILTQVQTIMQKEAKK